MVKRGIQTFVLGAVPLLILGGAVSLDHIPGTDIRLTVPYAAEGEGPVFNTLGQYDGVDVVQISGADVAETTGELAMTTVAVRSNMSFMQAIERWWGENDALIPRERLYPSNVSEEEVREANDQAFAESEASATIAAMRYLNKPVHAQVVKVLSDGASAEHLQDGDLITQINDEEIAGPSELRETVQEYEPGTQVDVHVLRDSKKLTKKITLGDNDSKASLGVAVQAAPGDGISVNYALNDVGGPSAGMIFSLAVIDKLSDGNLTGGKKVAGTGTIDNDGEVGTIGGITHKIEASVAAGNELFLAPAGNCAEANTADNGDMVVASVKDLPSAVKVLEDFAAGKEVPTCQPEANS